MANPLDDLREVGPSYPPIPERIRHKFGDRAIQAVVWMDERIRQAHKDFKYSTDPEAIALGEAVEAACKHWLAATNEEEVGSAAKQLSLRLSQFKHYMLFKAGLLSPEYPD
jgi:hypothetical protein